MTPTIQVGKNGVSEGLLDHLRTMCHSHDEITITFLQSFRRSNHVDPAIQQITAYLDPLYDVTTERRGHTVTLTVDD